ncbi:MAG: hypothetical protein WCE50_17550 [Candidatus Acidiferrum sp.]
MRALSEHLRNSILQWDRENDLDDKEGYEIVRKILTALASCRESLTEAGLAKIHDLFPEPKRLRWALDQHYSREVVASVPGIVSRLLQIDPATVGRVPNKQTDIYVSEATRCFIYGFPQATIALCRATVEMALDDSIRKRL